MTDPELHPYVEWIAREAKRSVVIDPRARSRLLDAIRAEPVPTPGRGSITRWIGEPRFDLDGDVVTDQQLRADHDIEQRQHRVHDARRERRTWVLPHVHQPRARDQRGRGLRRRLGQRLPAQH